MIFRVQHEKPTAARAQQFSPDGPQFLGLFIRLINRWKRYFTGHFLFMLPMRVHESGKLAQFTFLQRLERLIAEVFNVMKAFLHLLAVSRIAFLCAVSRQGPVHFAQHRFRTPLHAGKIK